MIINDVSFVETIHPKYCVILLTIENKSFLHMQLDLLIK
jgi:hypothetical protein